MKIIRLTTLLDFGGQEKQYISFTNKPELLNNQYIFSAIGHGGFAEKNIINKGFEVKILNQNPSISNIKNIWILYKWFRQQKPDIVHTAAAEANFHGVIAAKLAGIKTIIAEEIGFPNHSSKAQKVFRQVYKLTDKVIGVSKAVKENLIKIKEIKSDKGVVIYNPVTTPKASLIIKNENFTIVSVGRLELVKNQQLLIKAFARIENKAAQLILVGEGRERKNLEQLIMQLQLQNRVRITGFVSEPEKYLAQADLFVLPSLSEGFGIAVVEAMQLGIPCLCSRVGGIPEFVETGINGWLFNPENKDELVAQLNAISKLDTQERIQLGSRGKESVAHRFSEEKYIVTLEEFYKEIRLQNKFLLTY